MRSAFLLLAACTSSTPPPDACDVDLTGNVVDSTTACPTLVPGAGATQGDTLLHVTIPAPFVLAIDLDLGPTPTPGTYTSATTALWSASGTKLVPPGGACLFVAGNNATPSGDFTLDLDTLTHGDLALTLFVLPRTADDGTPTDCGPGTTEDVALHF